MTESNDIPEYHAYIDALAQLDQATAHLNSVSQPAEPLAPGRPVPVLTREQIEAQTAATAAWEDYEAKRDAYYQLINA